MTASQTKVVQYLDEAHAHERALVSVLMSQIAMTPRGSYRSALETHLRETRDHADRVGRRRKALGGGSGPLGSILGVAETVVGQALALGKTPIDMLRGSGGEEKVLKNAKDACATEALEIATYTAIERLARVVGDTQTADAGGLDPRRRGEDARAHHARAAQAHRRRRARRGQGRSLLRHQRDGRRRRRPRRRPQGGLDRAQDHQDGQAPVAPGPQGPGRRPHRGRRQGRCRLRGRPRDRALRLAQRRRDHEQARAPCRRSTSQRSTPTSARTRTAPR